MKLSGRIHDLNIFHMYEALDLILSTTNTYIRKDNSLSLVHTCCVLGFLNFDIYTWTLFF